MRSDHRFSGFCRDGGLLYRNGNGEAGIDRMAGKQSLQPFLDAKAQSKMSDSFKRFADIHLSRHAAELKSVFCQPLGDRYRDQLPRLTRDIDSILLLAGYYDPLVAQAWLENWQGLRHAIATGQRIEIEHFRNEANNQEPFWLHSGKR